MWHPLMPKAMLVISVPLENPAMFHSQCAHRQKGVLPKISPYKAPFFISFIRSRHPNFCRKPAPNHDVPLPASQWDPTGILPFPNMASGVYRFILVSYAHMAFLQSSFGSSRWFLANFRPT